MRSFNTCALVKLGVRGGLAAVFVSATLVAAEPERDAAVAPAANAPGTSSSSAAQDEGAGTRVDASQGGVTVASGVNSLTIGARVQIRWTLDDREAFDGDTAGSGVGRADGVQSAFDVPRMRVTMSGRAFRPWMWYYFQFDMSRTSGEGDSKIKDAIFEVRPPGRSYRVLVGQFKAPFGLQQLVSSGRQQFVDRAVTDAKFAPGREVGVMLSGSTAGRRVGYELGVFNGSGESRRQANGAHLYAGRVYVHPFGTYALAEGGNDAPDRTLLHIGVGARGGTEIRGRSPAGVVQDADAQRAVNVELGLKTRRTFATAEYFWMTDEQQNPVQGPDIDSRGYHAQVGYMVVPRTVELGLRYADVDGDTRVDDAALREIRGVVGYYWLSHSLKVQADVGRVSYGAGYGRLPSRARAGLPDLGTRLVSDRRLSDTQARVQVQVAF